MNKAKVVLKDYSVRFLAAKIIFNNVAVNQSTEERIRNLSTEIVQSIDSFDTNPVHYDYSSACDSMMTIGESANTLTVYAAKRKDFYVQGVALMLIDTVHKLYAELKHLQFPS